MLKKIISSIMFAAALSSFSLLADEFELMREERIGDLRIDLSEGEAKKGIDCSVKPGLEEFWAGDAVYHQQWVYAGCGITLDMVSEEKGAPKAIGSISVISPSKRITKRGIRIGSTEREVMNAYKADWNREDSENIGPGSFVAGSIYGGLIFYFKNGQVSKIFLGPGAE